MSSSGMLSLDLEPRQNSRPGPCQFTSFVPFLLRYSVSKKSVLFRESLTNHRCLKHEVMPRQSFSKQSAIDDSWRCVSLHFALDLEWGSAPWQGSGLTSARGGSLNARSDRLTSHWHFSQCTLIVTQAKMFKREILSLPTQSFSATRGFAVAKMVSPARKIVAGWFVFLSFSFCFYPNTWTPSFVSSFSTRSHVIPDFVFLVFSFFLQVCPVENLLPLVVDVAMSEFFLRNGRVFSTGILLERFSLDSSCVGSICTASQKCRNYSLAVLRDSVWRHGRVPVVALLFVTLERFCAPDKSQGDALTPDVEHGATCTTRSRTLAALARKWENSNSSLLENPATRSKRRALQHWLLVWWEKSISKNNLDDVCMCRSAEPERLLLETAKRCPSNDA